MQRKILNPIMGLHWMCVHEYGWDYTWRLIRPSLLWPHVCFSLFCLSLSLSLLPVTAIYLCKRTMQNKTRLELADYEAVSGPLRWQPTEKMEVFFWQKHISLDSHSYWQMLFYTWKYQLWALVIEKLKVKCVIYFQWSFLLSLLNAQR